MAIKEINTFIKASKKDAVWLAHQMGDAELHTLYIMDESFVMGKEPVGYLVVPMKKGEENER